VVLSTQGAEGITVPEILHFIGWGGIFLQVGFDDYLPVDDIPDNQGTVCVRLVCGCIRFSCLTPLVLFRGPCILCSDQRARAASLSVAQQDQDVARVPQLANVPSHGLRFRPRNGRHRLAGACIVVMKDGRVRPLTARPFSYE